MQRLENADWDHYAVIAWLLRQGRMLPDRDEVITALGEQLVAAGAPVSRVRLSMRTLHPLVQAVSFTWEHGQAILPATEARHGFRDNAAFIGSPVQAIAETGKPFRKQLERGLGAEDHQVLHELKAQGLTDYLGLPLPFSSGGRAILILGTQRPGGFRASDLEKLEIISMALSPVIEVFDARQIGLAVAEAYLGPRTGRRVLNGQITRGDIDTIEAAILISDIRDWTQMNQRLPARQAVVRANEYFELLAGAVESHDGEILKFLGDGVLAIFPSGDGSGDACARALNAAREARNPGAGPEDVSFGVGLHVGEVLYGNVGSQTRIDFTVLGQAVNIAARIESLCASLGSSILFSREFAERVSDPVVKVADQDLKGLDGQVPIYTLQDFSNRAM